MKNSSRNEINAWVNQQIERSLQLLQPKNIEKFSQFFLFSLADFFLVFVLFPTLSMRQCGLIHSLNFLVSRRQTVEAKRAKKKLILRKKIKNLRKLLKLIQKNFKKVEKLSKKVNQWRTNIKSERIFLLCTPHWTFLILMNNWTTKWRNKSWKRHKSKKNLSWGNSIARK